MNLSLPSRPAPVLIALALLLGGCGRSGPPPAAQAPAPAALTRAEFNRLAVRRNLPLYWVADANGNGNAEEAEVARLMFYPPWEGSIADAWRELTAARDETALDTNDPEVRRRALVRQDLDQGRATLVRSDLDGLAPAEKALVESLLRASQEIDALYAQQTGAAALAPQLPQDPESRSLFRRNWGPECVAALTQGKPECSAIPGSPHARVDVYPPAIDGIGQDQPGFCARLQTAGRPAALTEPFTVVREREGRLVAIPYTEAYGDTMSRVAGHLEAAAAAIQELGEAPLVAYLRAAATAFRTNQWWPADEAWSRMSAENSKWYVRVAPDEVYWEPCGFKAGFHLTLARVNPGAKEWQQRLSAVQQDLEAAIAAAAGPPYRARKVGFDLPEFIDIISNAGDDRAALGATIGQSLPNFGPVAKESRGRTVAMVNFYKDADSVASRRATAESLLDSASIADYDEDSAPDDFGTVLHEATHNLGPAQEYAVHGQPLRRLFGGPLNSLMEELKAQTGSLFLTGLLRERGIIDEAFERRVLTHSVVWALGHISQGMYSEPGHQRKTYSQLSAIQIGFLMDQGALRWDPQALAANGTDRGAFHIDREKLRPAIDAMMREVAGIKARGDRAAAEALAAKYVDGDRVPQATIAERYARQPRASMVYSITM